ncbi:DUF7261 family protein [Halomontanus rarus]|uniref:DUF7261 family protein n=1 Tax=Halomontanus rarus TaxID=3034020 RepID=UPI001A99718D
MVSDSSTLRSTRDRAQLILIAAIALAFIILGIVVVFNSVLYTQTMSSSSSIETTSDAQLAELEMARGVRGVAQEVNLNSSTNDIAGQSEAFINQYQNATAERRPAIVDVSVVGVSEPAQATDSDVSLGEVFNSSNDNDGEVGHFKLKLDSNELGSPIRVTSTNKSSGDETQLEISSTSNGFSFNDLEGDHCSVDQSESVVHFDFTTGTIAGGNTGNDDCSIKLINSNETYESLRFNGEEEGYYELIARGDDDLVENGNEVGHLAAWTVDLEYTYDTSELSVEREFEVDVYGDRR